MRARFAALPLMVLAIGLVLVAACGGDDSKAEKKSRDAATAVSSSVPAARSSTSAPSGSNASGSPASLTLNCGADLKSFRFEGTLALQAPDTSGSSGGSGVDIGSLFGSALSDVKFSGSAVTPDRTQVKLEIGGKDSFLAGQAIEFVQIGKDSYTKLGNTGWQQASSDNGPAQNLQDLDPRGICKGIQGSLPAGKKGTDEKVNGTDATRYDFDKNDLATSSGGVLGDLTNGQSLPDNAKLSVWVSKKEQFPVKLDLSAAGQQEGKPYSVALRFNVSDLNSSSIKIDAPR